MKGRVFILVKKIFVTKLFLASLSGFILGLAFNYPHLWPLTLVGLIPIIHIIYQPQVFRRQQFFYGFWFGLIYGLSFLIWHWDILPLDWLGISSYFAGSLLIFYVWFLPSVVIGLISGFWVWWVTIFKLNKWPDIFILSLSWPISEFLRSIGLSILWYGNGGLVGPSWAIGFLGYSLAPSLLISFASWGGVYLVGAMGVAVNLILYRLFVNYKDRLAWKLATGFLFLWVFSLANFYYFDQDTGHNAKFALINTYEQSFSRLQGGELTDFIARKKMIIESIVKDNLKPEIIVFPEDARVILGYKATNGLNNFNKMFPGQETLIIDSARIVGENGFAKLRFQYLNTKSSEIKEDDKLFLVPHGEYAPAITNFLGGVIGKSEWIRSLRYEEDPLLNKNELEGITFRGLRFQATACSEIILPTIHNKIVGTGSRVLINAASHSLFRGSPILYNQTLSMARIRAVENNRYFVTANNFIPTFVIDNRGNIVGETAWGKESVLYASVPLLEQGTFYNKIYRFLPWFLIFLALLWSFIFRVKYAKIGL